MERAGTITGLVVTRGSDGVIRPVADVAIGAFPLDVDEYPDRARLPVARSDGNGAFTMRLVGGPTVFRLATHSGWYGRAVSSSGRDVTDVGSRPAGNSSIVVELTKQLSVVSGAVKTRAGDPVMGASVVMISSDPGRVRRWSRFAAVAQCATDGSWSYSGLPSGQYLVFAVPGVTPEQADFEDVQWLQVYIGKATLVTVTEESASRVDVEFDEQQ